MLTFENKATSVSLNKSIYLELNSMANHYMRIDISGHTLHAISVVDHARRKSAQKFFLAKTVRTTLKISISSMTRQRHET